MPETVFADELQVKAQLRFPFYPLDMPGMAVPGPDFIEAAVALGDRRPKLLKNPDGSQTLDFYGPILEKLHYQALYDPNFSMRIKVKGRDATPTFIRGHLWGYQVSGPRPAKIMVVGKWPGMDEVQMGRNMVGPSGVITIRALEAAGLKQTDFASWYITNLIKYPNPDPSSNTAAASWIKDCLPLLEQELRLVRPKFILALGREAAKVLIDKDVKVDSAQGQVFTKLIPIHRPGEEPRYHEAKVMVSIHPARVARQADKLPEFTMSTKRFVNMIQGKELSDTNEVIDHRLIYSERALTQLADDIIKEGETEKDPQLIAIDCEWHGEDPLSPGAWLRTIQFSHKPGFAACIVFRQQGGKWVFAGGMNAVARQLARLLVATPTRRVRLAGHNLRADLPWVYHHIDKVLGRSLIQQFTGPELPDDTRHSGGFDTMLAAHSVTEAPGDMGFKLEVLALNVCGVPRYDVGVQRWKVKYCKKNGIKVGQLKGYGECPDDILHPYGCWDADATRRLVEAYNRPNGLLDRDQYGKNSRVPFWISMRASPAFLEMEMQGLLVDKARGDHLTNIFIQARSDLTDKLKELIHWPTFNPSSVQHCRTLLFGAHLAGKLDKQGNIINVAPPGVSSLNLEPIKSSGKPSKGWDRVVRANQTHIYSPSTDKEVLGILVTKLMKDEPLKSDIVGTLRYIRFGGQVLRSMLREPLLDPVTGLPEEDDDGFHVYEKGLLAHILSDQRVHTHLFQTKETGRASSSRPPLQNLSKRREKEYRKILGKDRYCYPLRACVMASPGYALVEADYMGAELLMMAVQAGDKTMVDHCLRANYPESDSRCYDIHSNVAVNAFKLKITDEAVAKAFKLSIGDPLPPLKSALELAKVENLRVAAKTIAFGIPYGRGNAAVIRAVEEEGVFLTEDDADKIREAIFTSYNMLPDYLERCKMRVAKPGWMANCFGRYRRFQQTGLEDGGEMQRQACNYPIQSGVADAVSRALDHLYWHPQRYTESGHERYRMVLQIHDAILFEVRIEDLDWFIGSHESPGIIHECMTAKVPIWSCDLDGKRISPDPVLMGTETKVMLYWGEDILMDQGAELGIPARFCKKPK